ncbi:hypothetical protein [Empedobacter tilapiae]|uniref:Carboxypeptidase regulatory-like domain-containing protein n=1 Tax=Empedobacter tilapiae TaxID=2491114 RepID=A0A4Z1BMG9_9FLAO|nr:hypothetical protein [Empedobacter tilapiae]TGN26069.1 hypothetical protein E4J94_11990 [Empedobacter tilapiae]
MIKHIQFKFCILFCLFFSLNLFANNSIGKGGSTEFYKELYAPSLQDPLIDLEIGKAMGSFNLVEKNKSYTSSINPNQLTEFPIGLKEVIDNVEYGIVVTKAKFTPDYALINVYARIITPQQGAEGGKKELYFGAEDVKLSYQGKIIGDAKLSLLGNVHIPFNNKEWLLTLEGGYLNKKEGSGGNSVNDLTYVVIDCDGIKELSLKGNVQVSRKVLVPVELETGKVIEDDEIRVRGDFSVKATNWNDLLVNVSISPFAVTKQTQKENQGYFTFYANQAILDMSDLRSDPNVVFPEYYATHGYLIDGTESWRGFYVESLHVGLPKEFKTEKNRTVPISFEAHHLIIDRYGVSGKFAANNIFPLKEGITGEKNAWSYSLDQIGVDLAASKIIGANLKGQMQLPIQNTKETTTNNLGTLAYTGYITEEEYLLSVSVQEKLDFSIWSAKASILPGSYVELLVRNKEFLPKAVLNGSLDIAANGKADQNNTEGQKESEFTGVEFQGLTLQTRGPIMTVDYFGTKGAHQIGNFPVTINKIVLQLNETQANLGLDITVGLQDGNFAARGAFFINGVVETNNLRQRWSYNGFRMSKLGLDRVDVGFAIVSGELEFMRDDPVYGKGFRAFLLAEKVKGLGENGTISLNAIFGRSTFRYWGFEGMVDGLKINTGYFNITGFSGGAFYRMIPDSQLSLQYKNRALVFKPDESVGVALRAGIFGNVGSKQAVSLMASFNISTNKNGGLRNIGFIGEAEVMNDLTLSFPNPLNKLQDKVHETIGGRFTQKLTQDLTSDNSPLKNVLDVNVDDYYPTELAGNAALSAKLAMDYDFNNKIFHANLDVNVSVGDFIKGTGPNGRAGWAVLHIAPDEWYMHIGTPTDMIGLKVGVGSFYVKSESYFMVGDRIPGSPPPPVEVAQILGLEQGDLDYMKNLNAIGEGKGFAFGSHFKFDTGDMTALFLYARFAAGFGADIMLKNYGDAVCSNRGGKQIGINGWYANGQAYVYLQGELGIKIKLFFIKKKIPIIKAGAAALLQARGPNPFWMRGYLGGYYNLLGGLIKGKFRFKLEFGEECKLENESVLGGMKIITDVTPQKEDTNVDVFAIPQATFALAVNEPVVIPEDDGDHTYKIIIDKFTIIDDAGKEIKGKIEYEASDRANFVSEDILPPNKKMKAVIEVSFMEKKGGAYQVMMVDGKKATEIEEREFTTGGAPTVIPLHNIQYAYPVVDQNNYYKKESNKGFIKLKRGQDYLFEDPNWTTKTILKAKEGKDLETDFTYDQAANEVRFAIPELANRTEYTLGIVAKSANGSSNQTSDNTSTSTNTQGEEEGSAVETETTTKKAQKLSKDGEIERLAFAFETSKYNTLEEKLNRLKFNHYWEKVSSDVIMLQNATTNGDEAFDIPELVGTKYTDNKPLINIHALMEDDFANKFNGLLYSKYPIDGLTLDRQEDQIGIPPIKALPVFSSYIMYLENNEPNSFLTNYFPYKYDLFRYYKSDWYELVSKAASKYMSIPANNRPSGINELINSSYGIVPKGKYTIKVQYLMPGEKNGTQKQLYFENK